MDGGYHASMKILGALHDPLARIAAFRSLVRLLF
jgi:hypothetical protein